MSNELVTKRFVIRKSLIGKNVVITFTNKKGDEITYNHDEVYERNKERFESMNCFQKYKSYTNTNNIPTFCRQSECYYKTVTIAYYYSLLNNLMSHFVTKRIRQQMDNIIE